VMAMGGFTGSDPTPTLDQLKSYIASGKLRFVIVSGVGGGFGGFGGDNTASVRDAWVTTTCHSVDYGGGTETTLYDCSGTVK